MTMTQKVIAAAVAAAFLLTAGYWFLLYSPRSEEQAQLETETETLRGEQQTLDAEIARLRAIEADESRITADLARVDTLIPADPAQQRALVQLQEVAGRTGAKLDSVTFSDPVASDTAVTTADGEQLGVIDATLVLEGGYGEAVDFVRALEDGIDRALLVKTVTVAAGEGGFPVLSTTLTASVFARIPAPPAPAATPVPGATPAPGVTPGPAATPTPGTT